MYLERNKWKNYHTKSSDAVIEECDEEYSEISTISVTELQEYVDSMMQHCKANNLDPSSTPVFISTKYGNKDLYTNVGLSICCSDKGSYMALTFTESDKLFYVAPDSKPEVGEYWRSRGVGYDLSGFVVSKLAGERLTRLVKYVLNTDEPLSHLDYREFEPNWIQFKFQKEEFNLELLDELARKNNNIVNEAILRQCMINEAL